MTTDTSREPDDEREDDDAEQEDDGGHRFPFDPRKDAGSPLGDSDEHSDADA